MIEDFRLTDVAVRWEGAGWTAYNIGRCPTYADQSWSTALGACEVEDIISMLFLNSIVVFLPSLAVP